MSVPLKLKLADKFNRGRKNIVSQVFEYPETGEVTNTYPTYVISGIPFDFHKVTKTETYKETVWLSAEPVKGETDKFQLYLSSSDRFNHHKKIPAANGKTYSAEEAKEAIKILVEKGFAGLGAKPAKFQFRAHITASPAT